MFSSELREKAEQLVGRYPVGRSALLPLLHLVQSQDGYLSDDGIAECAELLGLTKAEVAGVATFYTMYKRAPLGRHLISVCTNFSCKVRGAQDVYDRLSAKLGVGHNGTTEDGTFTLEHAECLGNCEGAPVVTVDYYNYECMTPSGAEDLLDRVADGDVPPPTRGISSPGIRMVSHRLAGLGPHPDEPSDRGHALGFATGTDGGAPPPATSEVGPQAEVQVVTSEFAGEREQERAEAQRQVRTAGQDPDEVEAEGGPDAREFPTRDPDAATGEGSGPAADDDAGEDGT
ncbi:MAG TPA: NAD(P)H-dependent oxidoreductase subunit E [Euzebyales bacterium]